MTLMTMSLMMILADPDKPFNTQVGYLHNLKEKVIKECNKKESL